MESVQPQPSWVRKAPIVLALLAAAVTGFAFLHISLYGERSCYYYFEGAGREYFEFITGWPVPFGRHHEDESAWAALLRPANLQAAACDLFLAVALVVATAVTIHRFVRRVLASLQFTIADMLALTTAVAMVLGVASLDRERSDRQLYTPLRTLSEFDQVTVLLSLGCAVALVFSSVFARLGSAGSSATSKTPATEESEDQTERAGDDKQR
jgi:hypothetical protein